MTWRSHLFSTGQSLARFCGRAWRSFPGKRNIAGFVAFLLAGFVPPSLSLVGLFLSLWIVIPAPTMTLLPLGVGAPEVSPWLIVGNAIALLLNFRILTQSWIYKVAIGGSLCALLLSLLPLSQFPAAHRQAAQTLQATIGPNYLASLPVAQTATLRPEPFSLWDAFRGIPSPPIRQTNAIPFAQPDGVPLTLNLYQPLAPGQYPALIVIYGGAWQRGTPTNDEAFSRYIAAQGYVVVAIDYRHAPRYPFPAQLEDVNTAIAFIQSHATEYEIDRDRLVVMGRSAGAHLAMLAAYQPKAPKLRAVINYYGPINLTSGYYDIPRPDPINSRAILRAFLGGTPDDLPELYRQASPYTYATDPVPPTLLIYAKRDHLVQAKFGQAMGDRLRQASNSATYLEIPWAEHAFDAVFNGVSNQLALYHTERFLAWATRPIPPA
jgi:acetyl esterase/lipase